MGGIGRGEHNIALINIKRIATALEVSVDHVMNSAKL